ncbi:4Fe-4S binding protein [Clostridium sp. D2Q-14]|uniref:[Fe-Fe] hydrogenase large subunit C-terminal domain-containing protein n=1 Tax=Anaeromonas gelatinilytica TaxID=2683194 RepID=UPI00193AF4E5|nr:[Fe-Fe] hydrogenase large subunit C-terminal domain-containing protein [Anaeromonas gelatinilytica]MBS4534626.1 4Fe-4S binding protein [Anaeromonas gelatinilytica]
MNFLNFSEANCKNCYKCLRYCPVKAIQFKNEQAIIVEERCIGCGQCMKVCPQEARSIKSELDEVKDAIKRNKKIVVTIAPTFSGAFEVDDPLKIISGLRNLGFDIIEETALGAEIVTDQYRKYIHERSPENIITTSCPSACYLIEKYYPSLIKYMIPIVSPMLAHGKLLKRVYGMDSFVVFIGPCTAKKIEASNFQHNSVIDAVLTFDEIAEWFDKENIDLNNLDTSQLDNFAMGDGLAYPIKGGVINNLLEGKKKDKYTLISVDGINECIELFKSLENKSINNVCVEAHVCNGSCIGGSAMPKDETDFYKRKFRVKKYIEQRRKIEDISHIKLPENINLSKKFFDKSLRDDEIMQEEIDKTLRDMGKYSKADELNCGACGYDTCRNKAIAIIKGMAEMDMCLPYMRSKAESLKNVIFENSPNGIIVMDENLNVKEFNPTSEKFFNISSEYIKDKPISIILNEDIFYEVKENKENILNKKVYYEEYNIVLIQNILYLKDQNVILSIMVDTTIEESNKKELNRVKEQTIDAAQSVIENQMRVAQEIASLLGETTAETKIILTKLKNISSGEMGDF